MSDVLVIGAHGKVGMLAAPLLVEAGHTVTGVIRDAGQAAEVEATGARTTVADVAELDTDALAELIGSRDVVVWSAGAGGGSPEKTWALDRDAAIRTADAAARTGARLVMVSYFGAGPDHGVDPESDFYPYAQSKTEADAHLAGTGTGWTILRPSTLTDSDGGGVQLGTDGVEAGQVARKTVARMITAVVGDPDAAAQRTIAFNDGDIPVDEVLAAG
ncbi:SDR family oxidoreductase [Rhodococcus aerolatus]